MKHYGIADWADYVRGLGKPSRRAAMREHLAERCKKCWGRVETLQSVARAADRERLETPPEHALRAVKNLYRLVRPETRKSLRTIGMNMVLDTSLAPAIAGVRSPESLSRRMLFQSSQFALDVEIDAAGSQAAKLVGQVMSPQEGPLVNRPVYMVSGGEIVCSGLTNDSGSFLLQGLRQESLELWVLAEDDLRISVDLDLSKAA